MEAVGETTAMDERRERAITSSQRARSANELIGGRYISDGAAPGTWIELDIDVVQRVRSSKSTLLH